MYANLTCVCLYLIPVMLSAASDQVPLGHPDFRPSPERPIGWRGDGSGIYPGATPVTDWDGPSGRNIVWKVAMPQFSTSSPIIVGERVISMAEPHTVLCYDIHTGERLWYNADDAVLAACTGDAAEAKRTRRLYDLYTTILCDKANRKKPLAEIAKQHPEVLPLQKLGAKLGGGDWGKRSWEDSPRYFLERGLQQTKYSNAIGRTFPTPVSDGASVYVTTGMHSAACYDITDGTLRWFRYFGAPPKFTESMAPSPLLIDGVLIATQGRIMRGLDAHSGKTLWTHDMTDEESAAYVAHDKLVRRDGPTGHYGVGTPLCLEVGGEPVIITTLGQAVRPSDGKLLCPYIGAMADCGGHSPVGDDENDIVFMFDYQDGGGGAATDRTWAIALTRKQDGRIGAETLWDVEDYGNTGGSPLYVAGVIFNNTLDAAESSTGKRLDIAPGRINSGGYSSPTLAGDLFITNNNQGDFSVTRFDREKHTLQKVGDQVLFESFGKKQRDQHSAIRAEQRQRAEAAREEGIVGFIPAMPGHGQWTTTYGSSPFFAGNRFVIRSRTHLYCVGDPSVRYTGGD